VPIVLKSGSLNFLEPSGPVQACNGIALPLHLPLPLPLPFTFYSLFDRRFNIILWQSPLSLKRFMPSGFPNKIFIPIYHLRTLRPTRKIPLTEAMKIIGLRFFLWSADTVNIACGYCRAHICVTC